MHEEITKQRLLETKCFGKDGVPNIIQWHFPHTGNKATVSDLLSSFCASASELQQNNSQIWITVPKASDIEAEAKEQGSIYNLCDATANNGYIMLPNDKYLFSDPDAGSRYGKHGYKHCQIITRKTVGNLRELGKVNIARQYVFHKVGQSYDEIMRIYEKEGLVKTCCGFNGEEVNIIDVNTQGFGSSPTVTGAPFTPTAAAKRALFEGNSDNAISADDDKMHPPPNNSINRYDSN